MPAPANLVIAGLPNHVFAAVASITAGADAGGDMGADNLKTPEPWEVARLTSVLPHEAWWECEWSSGIPLQTFGLVNHSLIPGDQVRVIGVESGSLPPVRSETLPPAGIVATINVGGTPTLSDVSEHPSAADGTTMRPDDPAIAWAVRLSFDTPAATPAVGGPFQCFSIVVKMTGTPADAADYPAVTAKLYEDSVERVNLGTKLVTQDGGQTLLFPWDASDLQAADGSDVELHLSFDAGHADTSAELDALSWEVLSAADLAAADLDTGWETITGAEVEDEWGGTALQEVDLPQPIWHDTSPDAVTLESIRVEFRADGVGTFTDFIHTPPRTPSGFVDVGVLVAGPAYEVPFNFAPGGSLRSAPTLVGDEEGIDGANRAIAAYRRRTCDVLLELLPESAAHSLFARLDSAAMGVTAFLLLLEPASTGTIARNTTMWAIVAESRGLVYAEGFSDGGEPLRSMGYLIEEKL